MSALAAIVYRDYRQRRTNIGWAFWDLFVPVAYLLLFGTGFEKALGQTFIIDGVNVGYTAFFLAGVLAMTAFTIAMNTSWGFFVDKDSGIFYELLTYPITRRQFLVGKICFNLMLSTIGSMLSIGLAILLMNVEIQWRYFPITLAGILGSTAGWFFFFSIFAIRLRRMDTFNTFTSVCYIILMFISTMFYPVDQVPVWFRYIARANPVTWQVDILRFGLLGVGSPSIVVFESIAFAAFALVCLGIAVRTIDNAG